MRTLASIDIETTGTDISRDRIVQIGIYFEGGDADNREDVNMLVNPGRPIPPDATAVHGITDEMVADAPTFQVVAPIIVSALSGCDLVGFNLINFDVPFLWEEIHRAGHVWDPSEHQIIDVCVLFKKMNPRNLSAAVKQYCGRDHAEAHTAFADAKAAADVLRAMRFRHEDLDVSNGELSAASRYDNRIDLAGKIVDNNGVACFSFGKNAGRAVASDPSYANWMLGADFPEQTKQVIRRLLSR